MGNTALEKPAREIYIVGLSREMFLLSVAKLEARSCGTREFLFIARRRNFATSFSNATPRDESDRARSLRSGNSLEKEDTIKPSNSLSLHD